MTSNLALEAAARAPPPPKLAYGSMPGQLPSVARTYLQGPIWKSGDTGWGDGGMGYDLGSINYSNERSYCFRWKPGSGVPGSQIVAAFFFVVIS